MIRTMFALFDRIDVQQRPTDVLLELDAEDAQTSGEMLDAELPWSSRFDGFRAYGAGDGWWLGQAPGWALS